ncbi:UNVERIFIED_ORG: transcriptional regulator with XRE-family HTH domain [Pseudomonas fluorescens]
MSVSPLGVCQIGSYIQMSGIGSRLRRERERLGLSQKVFGEIGGVEANAQGKYENGGRAPKADYLSRVAEKGVDILYVLTGNATPIQLENLSRIEEKVLGDYRAMFKEDQDAIRRLTSTLAEHSVALNGKIKPQAQDS